MYEYGFEAHPKQLLCSELEQVLRTHAHTDTNARKFIVLIDHA